VTVGGRLKAKSILDVLASLRDAHSVFKSVVLIDWHEPSKSAQVWVNLKPSLSDPFKKTFSKSGSGDDHLLFALEAVLRNSVAVLREPAFRFLETPAWYDPDLDSLVLPEAAILFFKFSKLGKPKTKTKARRRNPSTSMPVFGSNDYELLRSRQRRDRARADKIYAGRRHVGHRVGYLTIENESVDEANTWLPATPEAKTILDAANAAWGKSCTSYSELAEHLNDLGLKSLEGAVFKKNMISRLVIQLELLRGSESDQGSR
jgi:hypothetical protein